MLELIPPPLDMLDVSLVTFPGYAAVKSPGTAQWVTMDLTAGQTILICILPDPLTDGAPHAVEGMVLLADEAV